MRYTTNNEFEHFEFSEVHINEARLQNGKFQISLDDVVILPENSCNRDIRKMRANGLILSIADAKEISFVEEGYKHYDANGNLLREEEDVTLEAAQYSEVYEYFVDAYAFSITKEEDKYSFVIDGNNERTYTIVIQGTGDVEEWDKFLSIE